MMMGLGCQWCLGWARMSVIWERFWLGGWDMW